MPVIKSTADLTNGTLLSVRSVEIAFNYLCIQRLNEDMTN